MQKQPYEYASKHLVQISNNYNNKVDPELLHYKYTPLRQALNMKQNMKRKKSKK